jgi:hypothetical protein
LRSLRCIPVSSLVVLAYLVSPCAPAVAQTLSENFTDVSSLSSKGWGFRNNSSPAPSATTDWSQGDTSVFTAQGSADDSYIAASFESVGAGTPPGGTISNWLLTPTIALTNGDQISFYTRTLDDLAFPDRLEVRLSVNGSSSNVGATATSVGDFSRTLLTINPTLQVGAQGYPATWTRFVITLSGLPTGGTQGRVGFRYFVTNGGVNGVNSNYIGLDTVSVSSASSAAPEPSSLYLLCGGVALAMIGRRFYRV